MKRANLNLKKRENETSLDKNDECTYHVWKREILEGKMTRREVKPVFFFRRPEDAGQCEKKMESWRGLGR